MKHAVLVFVIWLYARSVWVEGACVGFHVFCYSCINVTDSAACFTQDLQQCTQTNPVCQRFTTYAATSTWQQTGYNSQCQEAGSCNHDSLTGGGSTPGLYEECAAGDRNVSCPDVSTQSGVHDVTAATTTPSGPAHNTTYSVSTQSGVHDVTAATTTPSGPAHSTTYSVPLWENNAKQARAVATTLLTLTLLQLFIC